MAVTTSVGGLPGVRRLRWGAGPAGAALAVLMVAGCSGADDADGAAASDGQTSKSPSAQATSEQPSVKPSVTAADGHDVGACADGDCEIAVSEPTTFRFKGPAGTATLSVTEVGPNKVEYTVKSGSNQSKGGASGPGQGCITVLRANGGGNSCGGLGD